MSKQHLLDAAGGFIDQIAGASGGSARRSPSRFPRFRQAPISAPPKMLASERRCVSGTTGPGT